MLLKLLGRALVSGSVATITSTAASALVARTEGKGALQPLNATSHVLYGAGAAAYRRADLDHTVVGIVTHTAATIFWATAFETALVLRPPRSAGDLLERAASIGALAAAADYTITPRRFTPGWELVLSKTSIAVVYVAMAAGFAGVALRRRAPDGAQG